jgi:hypothetical protein
MFLHSTLRELADTPPGPHVSLFLPTSPSSDTTLEGALHLKTLHKDALEQLLKNGFSPVEAEALLEPAEKLITDRPFWQHQQHGLALFLADGEFHEVSVDHTLQPRAVVGETFDVLPLMPGLTSNDAHVLLCVSQDEVAVYRADASGLEPVAILGMPSALDDVLTNADYENPVLASPPARPNLGTHNMSHSQVYGQAPPEWQAMVRRKFAGRIASSFTAHHEFAGLTVVLIADTEIAGDLAPAIGPDAVVQTHPQSLTESQRHAASWEAAAPCADQKRQTALESLQARLGRVDLVATDPAEVAQAASEGRVAMIALGSTSPDAILSAALWETLKHGGDAIWAGDATFSLPTGVAALLRY